MVYLCRMKYKLGDFVRFVEERMEGYITRIIDDQMIGVTGEDGFEIPVMASKVTSVHGHQLSGDASQAAGGSTPALSTGPFVSRGVYLGAAPDSRNASVVKFIIFNETSFQLQIALTGLKDKQYKGHFAGTVAPHSSVQIFTANLGELQLWPELLLHIIFYTPADAEPPVPIVYKNKFKAKEFAGAKQKLSNGEQGWLFRIDEPEVNIDAEKLKESFFTSATEKVLQVDKPQSEVDLHIEKLRDDYHFLSNSEILNIQLAFFNKALDAAIVHQLPEIVFIHGAGNGVLRNELHKALGRNNKVKTFMDARKEKFGYGATKVILK